MLVAFYLHGLIVFPSFSHKYYPTPACRRLCFVRITHYGFSSSFSTSQLLCRRKVNHAMPTYTSHDQVRQIHHSPFKLFVCTRYPGSDDRECFPSVHTSCIICINVLLNFLSQLLYIVKDLVPVMTHFYKQSNPTSRTTTRLKRASSFEQAEMRCRSVGARCTYYISFTTQSRKRTTKSR